MRRRRRWGSPQARIHVDLLLLAACAQLDRPFVEMALLEQEETRGLRRRWGREGLVPQRLEIDVAVLRADGAAPALADLVVHGEAQLVGVLVEDGTDLSGRLELRVRVVVVGAVQTQRRDRALEIDRGFCIVANTLANL